MAYGPSSVHLRQSRGTQRHRELGQQLDPALFAAGTLFFFFFCTVLGNPPGFLLGTSFTSYLLRLIDLSLELKWGPGTRLRWTMTAEAS